MTRTRLAADDPRRPLLLAWWSWDAHPGDPRRIKDLEDEVRSAASAMGIRALDLRRTLPAAKREGLDYIAALDRAAEMLGLDPATLPSVLSTPVDNPNPKETHP